MSVSYDDKITICSDLVENWDNVGTRAKGLRIWRPGLYMLAAPPTNHSVLVKSQSQSQSYFVIDSLSISTSWCRAHSGACDQMLFSFRRYISECCCPVFCWAPSLTRGRVCHLSVHSVLTQRVPPYSPHPHQPWCEVRANGWPRCLERGGTPKGAVSQAVIPLPKFFFINFL
jgi:hypothetical protein